jgi:hypothetical protein
MGGDDVPTYQLRDVRQPLQTDVELGSSVRGRSVTLLRLRFAQREARLKGAHRVAGDVIEKLIDDLDGPRPPRP